MRVVQDFVDHVCPGLAIDLHEGWDDGFYWFIPPRGAVDTRLADAIEDNVIAALRDATIATSSLHELVPSMPQEHLDRFVAWSDGRLEWRWPPIGTSPWGVAFMPYCLRHGIAYQTEVGRWMALDDRVRAQTVAATAAIWAFERAQT